MMYSLKLLRITSTLSSLTFDKSQFLKRLCRDLNRSWCLRQDVGVTCFPISFADRAKIHFKFPKEIENEYAHSVMENMPSYQRSIVRHPSTDKTKNHNVNYSSEVDAVEKFLLLSESNTDKPLNIEDPQFDDMIRTVADSLPNLSDLELINILSGLCLWPEKPTIKTPNFKYLWNSLDKECVKRLAKWPIEKQLLVGDYWFHLRLSKISQYNSKLIESLVRRVHTLSAPQIVQLLFYINLQRKVKSSIMNALERKINSIIPIIHFHELGIICLGFFKSRSKIVNKLLIRNILLSTIKHISESNEDSLISVLKQLKYSSRHEYKKDFIDLLNESVPCVKNWKPLTCIHLILLGTFVNLYHPEILNATVEQIMPRANELRLKDISRLLYCLSKYTHMPRNGEAIFEVLIDQLKSSERQEEINNYSIELLLSLIYLAYFNIYDEDLIRKVTNSIFVNRIEEKSRTAKMVSSREILILYYSAEIECSQYIREKLPVHKAEKYVKEIHEEILLERNNNTYQDKFLDCIIQNLKQMYHEDYFHLSCIMPYSVTSAILMCRDSNGTFLPIPKQIKHSSTEVLKPLSIYQWLCLRPLGRGSYSQDNRMLGLYIMMKRQFTKLNYIVIDIPWFEFLHLSDEDRRQYLHEKIS